MLGKVGCTMFQRFKYSREISISLAPLPSITAHSILRLPFIFSASRYRTTEPMTSKAEPSAWIILRGAVTGSNFNFRSSVTSLVTRGCVHPESKHPSVSQLLPPFSFVKTLHSRCALSEEDLAAFAILCYPLRNLHAVQDPFH